MFDLSQIRQEFSGRKISLISLPQKAGMLMVKAVGAVLSMMTEL
jgi:hypothetical protein